MARLARLTRREVVVWSAPSGKGLHELEYELVEYLRDPETMRAPPELKNIHPLGKSPVIDDDGLVLSESGAITRRTAAGCSTRGGT